MTVETGWLIEKQIAGRAVWWCGTRKSCGRDWTTDASEAVRFARKVDAENVIRSGVLDAFWVTPSSQAIATDHQWDPI